MNPRGYGMHPKKDGYPPSRSGSPPQFKEAFSPVKRFSSAIQGSLRNSRTHGANPRIKLKDFCFPWTHSIIQSPNTIF